MESTVAEGLALIVAQQQKQTRLMQALLAAYPAGGTPAPSPTPAPAPTPTPAPPAPSPGVPAPPPVATPVDPPAANFVNPIDEGVAFKLLEAQSIRYGTDSSYVDLVVTAGTPWVCDTGHFGGADPAPQQHKYCRLTTAGSAPVPAPPAPAPTPTPPPPPPPAPTPSAQPALPAGPAAGTLLASENGDFLVDGPITARYGVTGKWSEPKIINVGGSATNDFFGGDPAPGVGGKAAYSLGPINPNPFINPGADGTPIALGDAITNSSGVVVQSQYNSIAAQMAGPVGFAYLKGTAGIVSFSDNYYESVHTRFTQSQQKFAGAGLTTGWEKGGPVSEYEGNYFSNSGWAIHLADDYANNPGISNYQATAGGNQTLTAAPYWSWIIPDGVINSHYRAPMTDPQNTHQPIWGWHYSLNCRGAIAAAHSEGYPNWNMQPVVAWTPDPGDNRAVIANAQSMNNAHNGASTKLRAGLVPTDVWVSNGNEMAVISCWDTTNFKGVLAFIALAGVPNGYTLFKAQGLTLKNTDGSRRLETFWGNWNYLYAGMANVGNFGYMTVLGYYDIPNMKAPTTLFGTNGQNPWTEIGGQTPQRETLDLDNTTHRALFQTGGALEKSVARAGILVVGSLSERKVAYIDMAPLWKYIYDAYFTTLSNYNATRLGDSDATTFDKRHAPPTFTGGGTGSPVFIKEQTFANPVTHVKTSIWGPWRGIGQKLRSYIMTKDGTIHQFELGHFDVRGNTSVAADIVPVGWKIRVGANPVCMAFIRSTINQIGGTEFVEKVLVVSRALREVQWVNLYTGEILRRFRDVKVIDPVWVSDNEANGSASPVITIADHEGKAIHNILTDAFVANPQFGVCQYPGALTDPKCAPRDAGNNVVSFEYAGKLALPGKPKQCGSNNVP